MYKILTQIKGKLEEITENDQIKQINLYKRGIYTFNLNERPKCKICGSDLEFVKKGNYLIINKCLNDNCPTNNLSLKKGSPIKWKAFVPDELINQTNENKSKHCKQKFNVKYWINKGFSENEAIEKVNSIKNKLKISGSKNKGSNKKLQYIKKYGEELGLKKMYEDNPMHIEHWTKKGYSIEEAKNKISEIQSKNSKKVKNHQIISKEYLKSKGYNVELYLKEKSIYCIEYYLKRGYSEEEGKQFIQKYQSENSNKKSYENIKIQSPRCLEYWLNFGYNEIDAKEKLKQYQTTFSKEICIQKYGKIEGLKIFKERQEKWQKTLHDNKNLHVGYSKISQTLFNKLKKYTKNEIYYASLNREYTIYNNENKHVYAFDYVDLTNKKIIEFQGDIYHGNPLIFSENEYPNPWSKLTAKELWRKDEYKKQLAINNGFELIQIWEYDYRKDRNNVFNECKKFLNYE